MVFIKSNAINPRQHTLHVCEVEYFSIRNFLRRAGWGEYGSSPIASTAIESAKESIRQRIAVPQPRLNFGFWTFDFGLPARRRPHPDFHLHQFEMPLSRKGLGGL